MLFTGAFRGERRKTSFMSPPTQLSAWQLFKLCPAGVPFLPCGSLSAACTSAGGEGVCRPKGTGAKQHADQGGGGVLMAWAPL